jgi:5-methylcytosine-specific restriction enzyme A
MDTINDYVFKKEVDWSLLNEGVTIPIDAMEIIFMKLPDMQEHGNRCQVTIIFDKVAYFVNLINNAFNQSDWPTHKDILQFRYTPKHSFTQALRSIFSNSYNYILEHRTRGKHLVIPDNLKEYLVFYPTIKANTFIAEFITNSDMLEERKAMQNNDESLYEEYINYHATDEKADLIIRTGNIHIRKYNRTIGETLKNLYQNQCQICNHDFTDIYWVGLSEIHHIDYYTKSLNNDSDNLLVICPNHHRIIHKINPIFRKESMSYLYPNGLVEEVRLKKHFI